jgi:hypothetical protein
MSSKSDPLERHQADRYLSLTFLMFENLSTNGLADPP